MLASSNDLFIGSFVHSCLNVTEIVEQLTYAAGISVNAIFRGGIYVRGVGDVLVMTLVVT